ncbi:RNA-binding protein 48 [Choanephora cucurbitarum]|uniref:RNA-binding protein 48 n=1 Tax=Choanephora cucurbitarum TaxID=101091 RepID=A0A1C7NET6_9FUNG|nr:RNA-binding protein 48 [Choanephora cucurbitarum]
MTTRPEYRDPKKPRAVCVYTIAQESRYLIVENIPHLGVIDQLIQLCHSFGLVESHRPLDEISTDQTDVVLIQYAHIASARLAKRKLDDKPFFTQLLRVYYAPEYESLQDLRDKFQDRYQSVHARLHQPLKRTKDERKRKTFVYTVKEPTQETVQPTENNQKKRRRI